MEQMQRKVNTPSPLLPLKLPNSTGTSTSSHDDMCFLETSRERARLLQMTVIMEECEASTDVLQSQVDEARERSQRELDELRRHLQDKASELDKSRQAAKRLQDEVGEQMKG